MIQITISEDPFKGERIYIPTSHKKTTVQEFVNKYGYVINKPREERLEALEKALKEKSLDEIISILEDYKDLIETESGKDIINSDIEALYIMWYG